VSQTFVVYPTRFNPVRGALASCAIEGNSFARQLLETIRRIDNDEPVGLRYVTDLNRFMKSVKKQNDG
jgi:hypothetical protein